MVKRLSDPYDIIAYDLKKLRRLVKNLIIDNKNFETTERQLGYYFREYPKSYQYVHGPLRGHADYIVERINQIISYVESDDEVQDNQGNSDQEVQRVR